MQNLRTIAQTERPVARSSGSSNSSNRRQRPAPSPAPGELSAPEDAWLLGLLALHGLAMPADLPQAQQWFERAYMLGHPLAPAGLAWCQISGCVARPNPAAALQWTALLRRTDPALASYLEWHAARAMAPLPEAAPVPREPGAAPPSSDPLAQVHRLLVNAARAGNPQARNELGLEYVAAGDLEPALAQFNAASARSEAAAANAALLNSRIGNAATKTPGAARNSAADWYFQPRRDHRSEGVPSNYAEAVRLYQIAAGSGDGRARKMLELIFSRPAPDGTVNIAWMQQLAALDVSAGGATQAAPLAGTAYGWQRDPTPLYGLVPPEWRAANSSR